MHSTCILYDIEASKENFCSVTEIRKNGCFAQYQSKLKKKDKITLDQLHMYHFEIIFL